MKKFIIVVTLFALIIMLDACTDKNVVKPLAKGSVNGVVVDYVTGTPLGNVFISSEPAFTTKKTDNTGSFTLDNLEPNEYQIIAEKSDYEVAKVLVHITEGKTTSVNIPMMKKNLQYARLSGTILGSIDTLPLKDVELTINPEIDALKDLKTDADGKFDLSLPPGVYSITFIKKDYLTLVKTFSFNPFQTISKDFIMEFTEEYVNPTNVVDHLVYYSFDETDNYLQDFSGNNFNGVKSGTITTETGKFGNCIRTTGTTDASGGWISIPMILNETTFSINFWVKEISLAYSGGQSYFQIGLQNTGTCFIGRSVPWSISGGGTDLFYQFAVGGNNTQTTKQPLYVNDNSYTPANWNMFTLVYKTGTMTAYINGQNVGSQQQNFEIGTSNKIGIGIQWWSSNASTRLSAYYDEFRILNVGLTAQQVSLLYQNNIYSR
ncbi:MAG: carboxypeptidase regulatory-like domain-containing protein [bacterium]